MVLRIPMLFGVKQSPALRGTALSQGHAPRRVIASLELEHYPNFLVNLISGLVAYGLKPIKPALNLQIALPEVLY